MLFPDRRTAGAQLGEKLRALSPPDPIVLGLPRGGVPVAYEVALALDCPLDVLVVRKLGVPWQPELAMGAIGEGGVLVRSEDVLTAAGISEEELSRVVKSESAELRRRVRQYRSDDAAAFEGKTAIVVDDGLATGATAEAALRVAGSLGARTTWLAVPVAPRDTVQIMSRIAARVVVLSQPRSFGAVGLWYGDFAQTSDEEVRSLLEKSRLRWPD